MTDALSKSWSIFAASETGQRMMMMTTTCFSFSSLSSPLTSFFDRGGLSSTAASTAFVGWNTLRSRLSRLKAFLWPRLVSGLRKRSSCLHAEERFRLWPMRLRIRSGQRFWLRTRGGWWPGDLVLCGSCGTSEKMRITKLRSLYNRGKKCQPLLTEITHFKF